MQQILFQVTNLKIFLRKALLIYNIVFNEILKNLFLKDIFIELANILEGVSFHRIIAIK